MFTNEMVFTKENIKEYEIAFWKNRKGAKVYMGLLVLLFLSGLLNCIYGVANHELSSSSVLFVLAPLICAGAIVLRIKKDIALEYKRCQDLNGGKEQVCSYQVEDSIVLHNPVTNGTREIPFEQIAKVVETQNLILVLLRANMILPFDKDSLKGGTVEEFKEYIQCQRRK